MKRETQSRREFLEDALIVVAGLASAGNIIGSCFKVSKAEAKIKPYNLKAKVKFPLRESEQKTEGVLNQLDNELNKLKEEHQNFQISSPERLYPQYTEKDRKKAVEALYAEARGVAENREYLECVSKTFVTRALESKKPISKIIDESNQYSYLDKGDKNKVKSGNARQVAQLNPIEAEAYKLCEQAIDRVFSNGINTNELLTHYFVRKKSTPLTLNYCPEWAFEFIDGKAIPRVPEKTFEHDGKITRFYYLSPFEAERKGHVFTARAD